MQPTDVVVTGIGAITPLGADVPTTWTALLGGASGIRGDVLADAEAHGLGGVVAGTMTVDPADLLERDVLAPASGLVICCQPPWPSGR